MSPRGLLPIVRCTSYLSNAARGTAVSQFKLCRTFSYTPHRYAGQLENVRPMFDLKGKNFVVTGGGQGIGFAVSRAICEMGGNLAVMDLRENPVSDFNSLAKDFGVKTRYIRADVTKEDSLRKAFDAIISDLGSIDGCVTNAGIVLDKPFLDHDWENVQRILDVNVTGTFFTTQMAVEQMKKQGTGGSIVMLASVCAHVAVPGHRLAIYHASKGAVKMLSKALSVELAPLNIRTNTISPGYTDSDMTRKLREEFPHLVDLMHSAPPMKRIGTVNDLTGAMIYLLSDASKYTTGTDIQITGGLHAGRIEV